MKRLDGIKTYTAKEASQILGVPARTIAHWLKHGRIARFKRGTIIYGDLVQLCYIRQRREEGLTLKRICGADGLQWNAAHLEVLQQISLYEWSS